MPANSERRPVYRDPDFPPVVVRLTAEDVAFAHDIGRRRQEMNEARGVKQRPGTPAEGQLHKNLLGALGEYAVSKYYDIPWDGSLGDYDARDVGSIEVKTTTHPVGRLWVFIDSRKRAPYVLARVFGDTIKLIGWQSGTFILNNGLWECHGGAKCCYLDNDLLRDPRELMLYRDRLATPPAGNSGRVRTEFSRSPKSRPEIFFEGIQGSAG